LAVGVEGLRWGDGSCAPSPAGTEPGDGCLMPLGSTATNDPMKREERWNSLGTTIAIYKKKDRLGRNG